MFQTDLATKFKNSSGLKLLRGLFYETRDKGVPFVYTLKDEDHTIDGVVYPSLFKLYMSSEDLTEYTFATKYLADWDHWVRLTQANWFQPYLKRWRTELELRLKAEALRAIIDEARIGGRNSYDAKKYLIAKGWVDKTTEPSRRGRPSKAEIARNAAELVFGDKQIEEDLKRMGLN